MLKQCSQSGAWCTLLSMIYFFIADPPPPILQGFFFYICLQFRGPAIRAEPSAAFSPGVRCGLPKMVTLFGSWYQLFVSYASLSSQPVILEEANQAPISEGLKASRGKIWEAAHLLKQKLVDHTTSLLPHSEGQCSSQRQPRVKGKENMLRFLMDGTARSH